MKTNRALIWLVLITILVAMLLPALPAHSQTAHRRSTSMLVTAWNESTDRAAPPHWGYVHDLLSPRTSGWVRAHSNIYFGAEWYLGTADVSMTRQWISKHPGMHMRLASRQTGGLTDTVPIFDPAKGWHLYQTRARRFHNPAATGKAAWQLHKRRWTRTRANVGGFPVTFVSLHLTQKCGANPGTFWCADRRFEIQWVRQHIVQPEHARGRTVILGGDVNKDAPIFWGRRQVETHRGTMEVAAVPAAGVTAHIAVVNVLPKECWCGLYTDHATPRTKITLSE